MYYLVVCEADDREIIHTEFSDYLLISLNYLKTYFNLTSVLLFFIFVKGS